MFYRFVRCARKVVLRATCTGLTAGDEAALLDPFVSASDADVVLLCLAKPYVRERDRSLLRFKVVKSLNILPS